MGKKKKLNKKKKVKPDSAVDFTINDSANALKSVNKLKKSIATPVSELSWDQIQDENIDIVEELNEDGTKSIVYKKNRNNSQSEIDDSPGIVYPEILFYQISRFIDPEDIGRFAGINKPTYAITKRESFWRNIYRDFCANNPNLPERLKIENSYKVYGLRQRVIRALYHTYHVFKTKVVQQEAHDSRPHDLVKRCCINVWFYKGPLHWLVFFKFKKRNPYQKLAMNTGADFIEELGRVDANSEEDCQVLQVTCQNFYEIPPLMGMTLSSVSVVMSQGFRHHRMHLGFNSSFHSFSKDIQPECTVILEGVVNIVVFDWWHPQYPHFDNKLIMNMRDDESLPMLDKDFFSRESDL